MPAGEQPSGKRELLVWKAWLQVAGLVVLVGFFVLVLLAYLTYKSDPPIVRIAGESGNLLLWSGFDERRLAWLASAARLDRAT